jgi:hypothetical protein
MKRVWFMAAFVVTAGLVAAAEPRDPAIQISEIRGGPRAGRADGCGPDLSDPFAEFSLTASFAAGYIAGFAPERSQGVVGPEHGGMVESRGGGAVRRIVADRERGYFGGYTLELEPAADDKIRVAIKPLPEDYLLPNPSFCNRCPSWTAAGARLPRYPEPFEITNETTFLVDLLVNPTTGEKLMDRVKVVRLPKPSGASPRPPATGLKVKALFEWGEGKAPTLHARFCVRPVTAVGSVGPLLANPRIDVNPRGDGSGEGEASMNVVIRSQAGERRIDLKIRVVLPPGGKTGLYVVERREEGEIVHQDEVRFPLGT